MLRCSMLCFAALCACASTHEAEALEWSDDLGLQPLYSAYDGVHEYKLTPFIPSAAAEDADPIDVSSARWHVDASYLKRTGFAVLPGSLLLTTKRAGKTLLRVEATTRSGELRRGTLLLTISLAKPEEWDVGEARFSVGFALSIDRPAMWKPDPNMPGICGLPGDFEFSIPKTSACANCHAPGAPLGRPPTPTQTARYSDQQLLQLACMGAEPPSDFFESPFLQMAPDPDCLFRAMHTWELTETEHRGIVWKLRSIEPEVH